MATRRPIETAFQLQLMAAALLFSNVVFVMVAWILQETQALPAAQREILDPAQQRVFSLVLMLAALSAAAASFMIRPALVRRLPQGASVRQLSPAVVVPMAMAGGAGVFGLVLVMLTGNWIFAGILWGISIGAGILHFPTRGWIGRMTAPVQ